MEELSRLHKDVPFGWVQMLAQWLWTGRERRKPLPLVGRGWVGGVSAVGPGRRQQPPQ